MIKIERDRLTFCFPEIDAELKELLEAYAKEMLPVILAEDREKVIEQYLADHDRAGGTPGYRERVREVILGLSEEAIERQLRMHIPAGESRWHRPWGEASIEFQRSFRIPDDGNVYPLPPSFDEFPLREVKAHAERVPQAWRERGGVLMPMYQSEALWLSFRTEYPFAIKIGAGKINAVSGGPLKEGLQREPQDYVVTPGQPWLDGFAVAEGVIRQFVAMPLGEGYSVEEQLSGKAEFGGMQLEVIPMKVQRYYETQMLPWLPKRLADIVWNLMDCAVEFEACPEAQCESGMGMGLGAGGKIRQSIAKDPHAAEDWDVEHSGRCFVHLCDALLWREITGENPPHPPYTAQDYEEAGMPWFDYYRDDLAVLEGSKTLAGLKSVNTLCEEKNGHALEGNESVHVPGVIDCVTGQMKTVEEWEGA
jgi:hypothetical protein